MWWGIVAVWFAVFSVIWFEFFTLFSSNKEIEKTYMKEQLSRIDKCRSDTFLYITSQSLPFTFNVPIENICGRHYYIERINCDEYFCDYLIKFGKWPESSKVVAKIPKAKLVDWVESQNVERLVKLANFLRDYQNSFKDSYIVNHFRDLGDTNGYKGLENYADFFEEHGLRWRDLYSDGTVSHFFFCNSDGEDCSVNYLSKPFESKLKYVSPYTGRELEITIRR